MGKLLVSIYEAKDIFAKSHIHIQTCLFHNDCITLLRLMTLIRNSASFLVKSPILTSNHEAWRQLMWVAIPCVITGVWRYPQEKQGRQSTFLL